jgi:pimeloyl-ACP methyl ester carboxylesterase
MTIKRGYVDISAGQIHYAWRDGSGMPIVCFHQTASSNTSYHRIMEHAGLSQPIYALDTPGFGGSFDPEGMPTFTQYAAWLFEAVAALDLGPFHAMGHHTGAGICVELSATHADRVKSMILVGPFPLSAEEREEFRPHFSTPISPNEDGAYLLTTWKYLRGLGAHGELDVHHRELLNHVRAHYSRFQTYSSVWDYDFTTPYKNATCPILVMAAQEDVLYPYLQRAKDLQPGATLVELTGANYELELDTDGVVQAIKNFLA